MNDYGSTTRYNQLQNYPNNSINNYGISFADIFNRLSPQEAMPNNIADMQNVEMLARQDQNLLDDIINYIHGTGTGTMVGSNSTPVPQQYNQEPQPQAKGFGRPYVMSLQEYQDNYLPYYGLNYKDIPQEELPQR